MQEPSFVKLAADAVAGLRADHAIYCRRYAELQTFPEDRVQRFRREGHGKPESVNMKEVLKMKRCVVSMTVIVLLIAVFMVFLGGCAKSKKASISLGPKPAVGGGAPESGADRELSAEIDKDIDGMRSWLNTLSPSDAKQLEETGKLVLSYTQLKTSDPEHAKFLADYVENQRLESVKRRKDAGRPLRPEIATPHDPDTIEFTKTAPGAYNVKITTVGGIKEMHLVISNPK